MRIFTHTFVLTVLFLSAWITPSIRTAGEQREDALPFLEQDGLLPIGTIVPQPSPPDALSDRPTPVAIRIINRRKTPVYLQGFRGGKERVQIYLYHREEKEGWKPFFEFLPCDLPTCRGLHAPQTSCPKPTPFVVTLGPAGSADSFKEIPWEGSLYQRNEATQEDRSHRYCYKGWTPKTGRMRVEIEFSDTVQKGSDQGGIIGARDHAVIEFDLPPARPSYEMVIGEDSSPGASPSLDR